MWTRRAHRLASWTGWIVAGAALLGGCSPAAPAAAPEPRAPALTTMERTITVIGQGQVTAKPDVVRTTLGIEASARTVGEALKQANARMSEILAALAKVGVAAKDVRTANFSIGFERPQPPPMPMPEPGPRGARPLPAPPAEAPGFYRVSNTVEVTIRDVGRASEVLDAAVRAGANSVWGISFAIDDPRPVEAQAREKAVADARARAESLARWGGVSVGALVSLSEVIGAMPPPRPMMDVAMKSAGGPPIEAGESTVTAQVQATYAIAPAGK